jgi:transposase
VKIDGRTLSHETSEAIRRMAVQRVLDGERPSSVIQGYGLCRTVIYNWLRIAKRGGLDALKARKHPGRKPKLSTRQKLQVRRWISGKDPRQYGFDFGLWTRRIVAELVAQKFGIALGVTAVGRLLAELDVTPQKPLRRAYERDPVAIERWKKEIFPALRARAKRRCGDLLPRRGGRPLRPSPRAHLGSPWADARSSDERATPERQRDLGGQRPWRLLV